MNPPQDAFLFDCDLNGQYVPKQCDGFLNICWCVNSDGAMIDGSETKGGDPDCTPSMSTESFAIYKHIYFRNSLLLCNGYSNSLNFYKDEDGD